MKLTPPSLLLCAVLALSACSSQPLPPPPDDSVHFSADWRERARPMFNTGRGPGGNIAWEVPAILDRGEYRLIERHRDGGAEVIPGQRVKVDGMANKKIYVFLPVGYSQVAVLEEKYILDPKLKADGRFIQ